MIREISTKRFRITCLNTDPNKRTKFIEYHTKNNKVSVVFGEIYDSKEDVKVILERNDQLEDFRRDFRLKEARSIISARNCIINC